MAKNTSTTSNQSTKTPNNNHTNAKDYNATTQKPTLNSFRSFKKEDVEFYKKLGKKIKLLRKNIGITQKELAEILNITFQQVQKYETGKNRMPVDCLITICNTYKVNLIADYLEADLMYKNKLADLSQLKLVILLP